eukprot:gnl/MRDRNA2_/MRDRNA2_129175_c0_seq1.p1 gnl/MRDRNA2_/MRDRNA2_129175_c0~~gnl/MRDRNA2_/MRDRNA2_129175_c0_seq1.p1  ORF type:complete len:413 (-),score=117.66 gnl/MRDRNA2_/MRDRNA2_129175_c0_seq1:5-1126(-)
MVNHGGSQKMSRLAAKHTMSFPVAESTTGTRAKVQIFRRIACKSLDVGIQSEVAMPTTSGVGELRLKISPSNEDIGTSTAEPVKAKRIDEKVSLKEYVSKHNLENLLSDAMREVLKSKPSNPLEALVNHLQKVPSETPSVAPAPPPVAEVPSVKETPSAAPVAPITASKSEPEPTPVAEAPKVEAAKAEEKPETQTRELEIAETVKPAPGKATKQSAVKTKAKNDLLNGLKNGGLESALTSSGKSKKEVPAPGEPEVSKEETSPPDVKVEEKPTETAKEAEPAPWLVAGIRRTLDEGNIKVDSEKVQAQPEPVTASAPVVETPSAQAKIAKMTPEEKEACEKAAKEKAKSGLVAAFRAGSLAASLATLGKGAA